jgi:hypothetical protein
MLPKLVISSRWRFLLVFPLLALLGGCHKTMQISELSKHPDDYKSKEIRIRGRVVSSLSFPSAVKRGGFYVVSDGTGQLGVASPSSAPAQNSEVLVTGTVEEMPPVGLLVIKQFKIAPLMLEEKERQIEKEAVSAG